MTVKPRPREGIGDLIKDEWKVWTSVCVCWATCRLSIVVNLSLTPSAVVREKKLRVERNLRPLLLAFHFYRLLNN